MTDEGNPLAAIATLSYATNNVLIPVRRAVIQATSIPGGRYETIKVDMKPSKFPTHAQGKCGDPREKGRDTINI